MANETIRREISMPKIRVYGIRKHDDSSFSSVNGDELTSVPTISGHTVTNPGVYRFMEYAVIEMELGDYPSGIFTLADYTDKYNANDHNGAYTVGMDHSQGNVAQIMYRLDGKTPAPNFGNLYFTYFILIKPNYTNSGSTPDQHYESYIVENEIELTAVTMYGSQISTMNRLRLQLI